MKNSVTFKERHNYFNSIYGDLHPFNNKETRIYTKEKENFGITFTGEKIIHSPNRDMILNKKTLSKFKSIKPEKIQIEEKSPQEKVSFYLFNNMVPVKLNLIFLTFFFNLLIYIFTLGI